MLTAVVITVVLSFQLVSVYPMPDEAERECLEGAFHKKYASLEEKGFATCFPWQSKSCCSPEITVDLKENGEKNMMHFDWEYCGGLSEPCKKYLMSQSCFYYCDPNLIKWQTMGPMVKGVSVCSDTCDNWFEACKNDKTFSDNWFSYVMENYPKGIVKPETPCRTFAELFKNGEGLCNKIYGSSYKYEKSSNCMVFDFKGENPNDKVVPGPSSS